MNRLSTSSRNLIDYLPLLFLICLSGNPFFTAQNFSKNLLVLYTLIFSFYVYNKLGWILPIKAVIRLIILIAFILILVIFQKIILGFVSYPGVLALILKIILGLFTILFYKFKKLDILDSYIKIIAVFSIISLPFFILNQFGTYGFEIGSIKSLVFYTFMGDSNDFSYIRNAGMFWEPGAFAGYLLLALLFIAIKNGKFSIGSYKKEVLWIIIGLITSQSTTGFLVLLVILMIYAMQNFSWGKIIIFPLFLMIAIWSYTKLPFLQEKIESQFIGAEEMDDMDINNTRFGSLNMDWQYIKSQPIFGNGLDIKTRYRFHPDVTPDEDIGNGNGMSNFLAFWGIPFFIFWLYGVYKFARDTSRSRITAIISMLILILLLQGEQYLNYPMFLMFFSLPVAYNHTNIANNSK